MKVKHLLKDTDLSRSESAEVFQRTADIKKGRGKVATDVLAGQTWALLFHKSSTRTRVSFEVGVHEMGGHPMMLDQKRMQTGRGESVGDTARVLSRYVHGMIIRTYEQNFLEEFAKASSIPVINALTDEYHPCQVFSDLFTLTEKVGKAPGDLASLAGRRVVFYGDCNSNMARSWILGGAVAGMEVVLSGPPGFLPGAGVDRELETAGLEKTYRVETDPHKAASGADVIYTDVWVSMGTEDEQEKRLAEMRPYQVTGQIMNSAAREAVFLHCLPAHLGEEVSEEVYTSPASVVFDQAENRLHCQKALMEHLVRVRAS